MIRDRTAITRQAIRAALATRRKAGYSLECPVCPYVCAEKLGVEVRFLDAPSLEGMYASSGNGTIVISSLRWSGRQAFTCAHELAHHVLDHGSRWDEYIGEAADSTPSDPEEWMADRFASYLLMSKQAVLRSFGLRDWDSRRCTSEQAMVVAGELGVGYATLLNQMRWSLGMLDAGTTRGLLKVTPKLLREQAVGEDRVSQLVVTDSAWARETVDIQVGEGVLLPSGTMVKGRATILEAAPHGALLAKGQRPGIVQAYREDRDWACFIRVSRKDYVGRATWRHMEDPDVEQ